MRARRGRHDRRGSSAAGSWSRLGPIAKHKKVCARLLWSSVYEIWFWLAGRVV